MNMKQNFTLPRSVSSRKVACPQRHGAFTLVELMVVVAIAAIVSGLTLGGYRSVADGNERVSCQTNLTQIYSAIQLYSKDYDGYYPYHDPGATLDGTTGLGLWALYALRSEASADQPAPLGEQFGGSDHDKPFGLYARNRKILHCPADADNSDFLDAAGAISNSYLSYQVQDGTEWTYQPWRGVADGQWNTKRQLLLFQTSPSLKLRRIHPVEDAVITWCPWHRGRRDMDNVLFASGTVRPVPKTQANPNYPVPTPQPAEPAELEGWNRKPAF